MRVTELVTLAQSGEKHGIFFFISMVLPCPFTWSGCLTQLPTERQHA